MRTAPLALDVDLGPVTVSKQAPVDPVPHLRAQQQAATGLHARPVGRRRGDRARRRVQRHPFSCRCIMSDLDLHYARLGWIWQPWLIPERLRLCPILEAKAFVAEMTLEAPALVPRLKRPSTSPSSSPRSAWRRTSGWIP